MPSLIEYFHAMRAVYKDDGGNPFAGWEKVRICYENGFGAACYINREQQEVIISFRGTQLIEQSNLRDDLQLAFGGLPESFSQACRFDDQLRDNITGVIPINFNITYVGHSLGAVHATLIACLRKGVAITLESPGVAPLIERNIRFIEGAREARIINFLSAPNVINTLHPQVGQSFRVYTDHVEDLSYNHAAKCILGSVKRTAASVAAVTTTLATGGSTVLATASVVASGIATTTDRISNHFIIKAIDYLTWLHRQHSAKNLYQALHQDEGYYPKIARIESWPNLTMAYPFLLGTTTSTLNTWVPFHADVEGLHTLFDENRLLEQRLQNIPGYVLTVLDEEREAIAYQRELLHALHPQRLMVDRRPLAMTPNTDIMRALVTYTIASQHHLSYVLETPSSEADALVVRELSATDTTLIFMQPDETDVDRVYNALQRRMAESQSIIPVEPSSSALVFATEQAHTVFAASDRVRRTTTASMAGLTREQFIAQQESQAKETATDAFNMTYG